MENLKNEKHNILMIPSSHCKGQTDGDTEAINQDSTSLQSGT